VASKPILIGVLGLQGDFREHIVRFAELGCDVRDVRRTRDLDGLDALVLPGGESTAVGILERSEQDFRNADPQRGIFDAIRELGETGLPMWGTCMGSILLAKHIEGSTQGRLALMDITVKRNAFGPQRFSSETPLHIPALGEHAFPGVFIRAPLITQTGSGVEVLATIGDGVAMARQGNLLATVFHPEVVQDDRVHRYFLRLVAESIAMREHAVSAASGR
jgi:5'-phosphate synthase pdxT subunit